MMGGYDLESDDFLLSLERLVGRMEEECLCGSIDEENDSGGLSRVAVEASENENRIDCCDSDVGDHSIVIFETVE